MAGPDPTHDVGVPDDAPPAVLSLRRLNERLGNLEEILLAGSLAILVGTSVYFAFASKVLHSTATWPYEVIRYMVFFVAMSGASLAAQRQGMFNMDLVTQKFTPRGRSYLRVASAVLVVVLCGLVVKSGLDLRANAGTLNEDHEFMSEGTAALGVVVGFSLIAIHYVLHGLAEVLYWVAGKQPPEPPRGGHG